MRWQTLFALAALGTLAALTAFLAPAAGYASPSQNPAETVEKTFRMDAGKPIDLVFRDVDGLLVLRPSSDETISVKVRKEAVTKDAKKAERLLRETTVDLEQRGNEVSVRVRYPRLRGIFFWVWDLSRVRVVSEIAVPAGTRVRADLVDGSITGDGLRGDLRLETVDGDIRIGGFAGRLDAETVDGRIAVRGELAGLRLSTIDGDVQIEAAPGSAIADAWSVRTADGDIDLALPPGFAADLTVQGGGKLETAIPLEGPGQTRGRKLTARIGGGGKPFSLRTTDGGIHIR